MVRRYARTNIRRACFALLIATSCGDGGSDQPVDAGPCWPLPSTPGGEVTAGTGSSIFEPMPATLTPIRGASQSDPYLEIHAHMRGLPPGDPDNVLDPQNPKTKVSAEIADLGLTLGVECPASLGYVQGDEPDTFDLVHSLRVGFGMYPLEDVDGREARITVEVVGADGHYARDEKTVILTAPVPPDAGVDAM